MVEQSIKPRSETLEAALSIIPYLTGDSAESKKGEYLAYRFTGFSIREAAQLTSIHEKSVRRWRVEDDRFKQLELEASGPGRAELRREVLHLLFVRNYHLVLRKDYEVLRRVLGYDLGAIGAEPQPLTRAEIDYLNRARAHYTPQQFEAIEQLINGQQGREFDFSDFILKVYRRTKEEGVEIRRQLEPGQESTDGDSQDAQSAE